MSAIWVKCLYCEHKFDIEDCLEDVFRCPVCNSQQFEYDEDMRDIDSYYKKNDKDTEYYGKF